MNNGGSSISCAKCAEGKVQSNDGFRCVTCKNCDKCSKNAFKRDMNEEGKPLDFSECIECDADNSLATENGCISCKPFIFADTSPVSSSTCNVESSKKFGGLIFVDFTTLEANADPNVNYVVFERPLVSPYFESYSLAAFRACRLKEKRNMTSCQALVNMCALNMYNFVSEGQFATDFDVCEAYYRLFGQELTANGLPQVELANYGSYKSNYELFGIDSFKFKIQMGRSASYQFYAAVYDLSGHLKSFGQFNVAKLQLCNLLNAANSHPFSSVSFTQRCRVSVQSLLDYFASRREDTLFYDLYLSMENRTSLAPIFAKILNYKRQNVLTNLQSNENAHILSRRFFLVDTISTQMKSGEAPLYVRYAKSITLKISLVDDESTGQIYPPIFVIDYGYASTVNRQAQVDIEFRVEYNMNIGIYVTVMWIVFGSLSGVAFIWTLIRTWNWNRRAGKLAVDLVTLFKFAMFLVGSVANAAFLTLIGFCIFWFIFYKGQSVAILFLPTKVQERMFMILMIIALALKILDMLYLVLLQSSYDIFFIDWEKPKTNGVVEFAQRIERPPKPASRLIGGKSVDETEMEPIPASSDTQPSRSHDVSCWRTLFVANEWNELQTFRKTNQTFQIVFLLFLLKFVNLEAFAKRTLDNNLGAETNEAEYSGILRIGLAASLYTAIGEFSFFRLYSKLSFCTHSFPFLELFQLIVYHVVYSRCIDNKLTKFIDFCSLSNISMFIMTHTQFGYYIHGRSPHGNADTNIQHMTQSLLKEELDLTSRRGLIDDHQTFSISVMSKLTRQYSKVMQPIYQVSF